MFQIHSAEILCVGTEILIGDIVNTNAAYISKRLAALGINQYYQAVVGDNPQRLEEKIREALTRCDLLIMTGGLGPTYDDLTKETAARCMGRKLYLHERSLERMSAYFTSMNRTMTENNRKQAYMPEGSVVFDNDHGTAPGLAMEDEADSKIVIMLPGPPREMVPMWDDSVEPYLRQFSEAVFYSRNINITGMGESAVENVLRDYMEKAVNPTVAPYCKEGEVRLRVTARVKTPEEGRALCDRAIAEIAATEVGKYIYGIDTTLEEAAVRLLAEAGKHVATAESCTGGLIAKRITEVSGSSAVFDGSVVSYANRIKEKLVGVKAETLEKYGAVSEETAREMACGIREVIGADYGIGVTGIAGPTGGTPEKPVGLVYVSLADEKECQVVRLTLKGDREHIRTLTSNHALAMLIRRLKGISL